MVVYLFYGDEAYRLEREVGHLRRQFVTPEMASLAHKVLKSPSISNLLETLGTPALNLWGETLVEIQGFSPLEKAVSQEFEKKQLEELKELLSQETPGKQILFVSSKVDGKVGFAKWIKGQGSIQVKEFKKLEFWKTDEAVHSLMQEAKALKVEITPPAATLLVEQFGVELLPLMNEVQKLALYTAGKPITPQEVQRLCPHNENTFQMLALWVKGQNHGQVFEILEELLLRQHPVQLFALIQSYVNNLFRLRIWEQARIPQAQMADRLKKHPFKVKKDLQEASQIPLPRLRNLREQALQLEWKMKTGQISDRLAIEMLLGG